MYYGYTDTDKKALQQNWGLNPESYIGSIGKPEDIIEDITVPVLLLDIGLVIPYNYHMRN